MEDCSSARLPSRDGMHRGKRVARWAHRGRTNGDRAGRRRDWMRGWRGTRPRVEARSRIECPRCARSRLRNGFEGLRIFSIARHMFKAAAEHLYPAAIHSSQPMIGRALETCDDQAQLLALGRHELTHRLPEALPHCRSGRNTPANYLYARFVIGLGNARGRSLVHAWRGFVLSGRRSVCSCIPKRWPHGIAMIDGFLHDSPH